MSYQSSFAKQKVLPIQVWRDLAIDCQTRVIHLMAKLACKLIVDQPTCKEENHGIVSPHAQDST